MTEDAKPRYTGWILAAVFLLGLGLRVYCLNCNSLWYDEVASIETAQRGIEAFFTDLFGWAANQTPFHYLLVWLTIQPVDPAADATLVRLPSALAGALTILVAYGLGRELFGRAVGLLTALFVSLSVPLLDFSQDVRPYAMLAFLSGLSVYCLLVAERKSSLIWWLAFAGATSLNLLNSYVALTIFLPALAPYLLWTLWKLWSQRDKQWQPLVYCISAIAIVALVAVSIYLSLGSSTRTPLNLSKLTLEDVVNVPIALMAWLTGVGVETKLAQFIQWGLIMLAVLGLYSAIRAGRGQAAFLCVLMIIVPSLIYATLLTTYRVFPRYVIFAAPFYLLLVMNGLWSLTSGTIEHWKVGRFQMRLPTKLLKITGTGLISLVSITFIVGAYNYLDPSTHTTAAYRADFRGATRYLSEHARPQDVIVFIDDPTLGYEVSDFYWKGKPPAPTYDSRDPLLVTQKLNGDIYWVIASLDAELVWGISAPEQQWSDVVPLYKASVLREARPAGNIIDSLERMVSKLEAISPDYQPIITLKGCVAQARGDFNDAARIFTEAGSYFRLDEEYLRTAQGFAARGDLQRAWSNANIAKFMRPGNAEVHIWMAQQLKREGHEDQSRAEMEIARVLQAAAQK